MKLKFSSKLIIINIAVAAVLTAVIGFIVVQGLMITSLQNAVRNLTVTADESVVMIRQSILSLATEDEPENVYAQNGDYYASQIASIYGVSVMLFDSGNHLVGTSTTLESYTEYSEYSSQILAANTQGYVLTSYDESDYIIFCSPVVITNGAVGTIVLLYSAANLSAIASSTASLFVFAGIVAAIIASVIYFFSYRRITKPINQLVEFTSTAGDEEKIKFPEIHYFANDEIGLLVDGFKELTIKVNEKIDELNLEKEKIDTVFSSMQDGVLTVNSQGNTILFNDRLNEMFSNQANLKEIIPDYFSIVNQLTEDKTNLSGEFSYENKNYFFNAKRIVMSESSYGVLFVISDITAIKKIEEEQDRFISSVSHELKTPLTTIIGYTDLLERRGFEDKDLTKKALTTLRSEGNRLLRLVNDLLNINKFHSYDFDLIFTNIDPDKLLSQVAVEMNITAASYNMLIAYDSSPLPEIKGDYDRLKQTLINIVDNAIKYSHFGDVIKISAIPHDDMLEITVRDFGEGIPEDKQSKVFETFYRVEEDRSRLSLKGGFGLGLSIVKNIIHRHNGTVSIESMPGSGTLVVITLPIIEEAKQVEEEVEDEE